MTSTAFTGTRFVPALAHDPFGNFRATMAEWPLPSLGTMIVQCMAHALDPELGNATVFEVWVEFIHVADAASLEAALAIVSDKYSHQAPATTFVGTWPRPVV